MLQNKEKKTTDKRSLTGKYPACKGGGIYEVLGVSLKIHFSLSLLRILRMVTTMASIALKGIKNLPRKVRICRETAIHMEAIYHNNFQENFNFYSVFKNSDNTTLSASVKAAAFCASRPV